MSSPSTLQDIQFLRSQPLASLVQKEIERQILSGEFEAGKRLNELEIARTLGISRVPVRECLRTLEQTGLVISRKNYGVYVRTVSLEDAREIYQMRSYIDAGVGQELAQSIAVSDFRSLEQMVARMEKAHAKRDAVAYHEINMAFHERMVELVGNRKLLDVYRKLLNELTLYRRQSLAQPGAMDHSAAEHRDILAAIKSGDGDAAGRVMRDHIMASSGRLQRAHETPRTRKTK
ncbi:MAG: FCD domain-containing protein [Betaproteobacteria bacterium]|nr:FCD domain-containing protein [Betaproteobacteria bacterium]MBI3054235.1 FCD domain-containing protein [Betaproteobacteria bacterium]